jgi:hypothetical protein
MVQHARETRSAVVEHSAGVARTETPPQVAINLPIRPFSPFYPFDKVSKVGHAASLSPSNGAGFGFWTRG